MARPQSISFIGDGIALLALLLLVTMTTPEGMFASIRSGVRLAGRHGVVRGVCVTLLVGVAFAAMDNVALIFLARDEFLLDPAGVGLLSSAFGIGMVAASAGLLRLGVGASPRFVFVLGWLLTGGGGALTGAAPIAAVAFAAQALGGAGNGMENVAADTLIQQTVPKDMLGRAFGLSTTAAFIGGAIAYAAGGLLLELTSSRAVFVIAGAGTILAVAAGRLLMSR